MFCSFFRIVLFFVLKIVLKIVLFLFFFRMSQKRKASKLRPLDEFDAIEWDSDESYMSDDNTYGDDGEVVDNVLETPMYNQNIKQFESLAAGTSKFNCINLCDEDSPSDDDVVCIGIVSDDGNGKIEWVPETPQRERVQSLVPPPLIRHKAMKRCDNDMPSPLTLDTEMIRLKNNVGDFNKLFARNNEIPLDVEFEINDIKRMVPWQVVESANIMAEYWKFRRRFERHSMLRIFKDIFENEDELDEWISYYWFEARCMDWTVEDFCLDWYNSLTQND